MTVQSGIAKDIQAIVKSRPGTSFVELQRGLAAQGYEVDGGWALEPGHNIIMWANMSREFFDGIIEARSNGLIHPHPLLSDFEIFVVYAGDGAMLNLPYARRPPKSGYKDLHWLPTVFHLGTHCNSKNCPGPMDQEATS